MDTVGGPGAEESDAARARRRRTGRRRGFGLIALGIVWLVLGTLAVFAVAIIGGTRGAPPDLVASEPQPVEGGSHRLSGDSPYVLVSSAPIDAEPACSITGPDGEEVEYEVAANWEHSERPAIARFYADETGDHALGCTAGGSELEVAVADDGAWEWDREGEAHERRMVIAVVVVALIGTAVLVTGTSQIVRNRA
ncbi:hypothetical protein ACPYO6_13635 [Georgenia sp. Z1344]|uniref:hypothetical protein n=1 Tax=Georgenia sp. Z1344 TaxID=3416706 RepID=UPI003CF8CEC4